MKNIIILLSIIFSLYSCEVDFSKNRYENEYYNYFITTLDEDKIAIKYIVLETCEEVRDKNKLGKVTDVADIFFSHDPVHKFGTVYSVLFSTFKLAPLMYTKLTSQMGIKSVTIESVPFTTFFILNKLGFDLPMREDILDKQGLYVHLIGNILLRGRNCASVEDVSLGDSIMVDYVDRFRSTLSDKHKRIVRI